MSIRAPRNRQQGKRRGCKIRAPRAMGAGRLVQRGLMAPCDQRGVFHRVPRASPADARILHPRLRPCYEVASCSSTCYAFSDLHDDILPERPAVRPWAYLITFSCYRTKLHGRAAGSVDPDHNAWRGRYLQENRALRNYERSAMRHPAEPLRKEERQSVLAVIREICRRQLWFLHAAHVRSNHVHSSSPRGPSPNKS